MKKEPSSSRIVTLDLLRGYFLIVILLNHLHYFPSGLEWITGQSYLYASTAEGFFLLSGIVLGIVRGAKLIKQPIKVANKLLLKRAFQLYLTSIILVFLFTFIGWIFINNPGLKYGIFPLGGSFFELIWQTLTFQYAYGWADYLRMYALFILLAPLALWLLRKGLWYVVILASIGIWLLYPFSFWPPGELSQPFSWQLIFFSGFVIGFHLEDIKKWWTKHSAAFRRNIIIVTSVLSVVTLILNIFVIFGDALPGIGHTLASYDDMLSPYFNKDILPVPRLLLFGLWFTSLYFLFRRFETQISRRLGWLLLPLGTNSLYTYTIQSFIVFFLMLLMPKPSGLWFINLIVSLAAISVVYLAVRTKFLMKIIPR